MLDKDFKIPLVRFKVMYTECLRLGETICSLYFVYKNGEMTLEFSRFSRRYRVLIACFMYFLFYFTRLYFYYNEKFKIMIMNEPFSMHLRGLHYRTSYLI